MAEISPTEACSVTPSKPVAEMFASNVLKILSSVTTYPPVLACVYLFVYVFIYLCL